MIDYGVEENIDLMANKIIVNGLKSFFIYN